MLKELEQLKREKSDFEKFQRLLEKRNPNIVNLQSVGETYFQTIRKNLKEYKSLPNRTLKYWKKTISFHVWAIEQLKKDGCSESFLTYLKHVKVRNKKHKFYLDNGNVGFKPSEIEKEYVKKRISELDQMINIISNNTTENENEEAQTKTRLVKRRMIVEEENSGNSATAKTNEEVFNGVVLESSGEEELSNQEQFTEEEAKRGKNKDISSDSFQTGEGSSSWRKGHRKSDSTDSGYSSAEGKSLRKEISRLTRLARKATYDNLKTHKNNFEKELAEEKR